MTLRGSQRRAGIKPDEGGFPNEGIVTGTNVPREIGDDQQISPESIGLLDQMWEKATAELDARQKALKELAQQRGELNREQTVLAKDRSLAERCLGFNAGPPMLPGPYNNYMQLFQFKDHVIIFNEMIHDARVVPLDGRPHLPQSVRRYLGDSVGRWEGNTLVVDTTNFTDKTNFRGASDRMHLIEKFSRPDADTLLYEFTVEDPTSFTKSWSGAVPMKRTDEQLYEYACHEGNEAMVGILGGARYEDKQK